MPSFYRCGNEVGDLIYSKSCGLSVAKLRFEPHKRYPTLPFESWSYCANKATSEPAHIRLPNLSHGCCFFGHAVYMKANNKPAPIQLPGLSLPHCFLPPSICCQVHSVKCFQIRVLLCSLSDSLLSTLPSSRNSSLAIAKIFSPSLSPPLAGFQVLGYGSGSLHAVNLWDKTQFGATKEATLGS